MAAPGASHAARGAAPREGHAPAPQCTAGRVPRRGGDRRGRYGPAPPGPRPFPSGSPGPLPSRPASRRGAGHPQTGPRAGVKPASWEARRSGGARLPGASSLQPLGLWGLVDGGGPSADDPRVSGSPEGALAGRTVAERAFPGAQLSEAPPPPWAAQGRREPGAAFPVSLRQGLPLRFVGIDWASNPGIGPRRLSESS